MTRIFTAGTETEAAAYVHNPRLNCEVGTTDFLEGDYAPAQMEMRFSEDYGNTWSEWETISLGEQGDYTVRAMWYALGLFNFPAAIFQFRITDPVAFRVTSVELNAPYGGK